MCIRAAALADPPVLFKFKREGISLNQLVYQVSFPKLADVKKDASRTDTVILCGVWSLAVKYDLPGLRFHIASHLVSTATLSATSTNTPHLDLAQFYYQATSSNFLSTYDLIHEFFNESTEMQDLETKMALCLANGKTQTIRYDRCKALPILADDRPYKTPLSDGLEHFRSKTEGYTRSNASFATKYAQALETVVNKAFMCGTWSDKRLLEFVSAV